MKSVTLDRPTGKNELKLIEDSGFKAFPPRLPEQPRFYPVLNEEYATKIARDWNAKHNPDKLGLVIRFEMKKEFNVENFTLLSTDSVFAKYTVDLIDANTY